LSDRPASALSGHSVKHSVPLDNAEGRLTTYERHVVSHYRLGEALEAERANLFGYDASP